MKSLVLMRAEADQLRMMNQSLTDELSRLKQRNELDRPQGLVESDLRFRCLLEILPAAVYTCDAQGLITYFNHKAESIWGVTPQLGDPDKRFCGSFRLYLPDGPSLPHDETPMARALSENRGFCNMEVIIERPDGSRVSVLVNIDPIHDENGKVIGAVNAFTDNTERKRIEEALREAKEVAEKASRAKDDFIATLSHELRTPLTPALITATFMEHDPTLAPDIGHQFGVIRHNIELEARLIDDLLDLTKIAHGKCCLRCESADIHDLLARSIETVREGILLKELKVEMDMAADCAVAKVDTARFQQVFWNLLRNAIKFTPAGGGLFVRTYNSEPHSISIEFRDTGIGILPENIERIFLPFEQVAVGDHRFGGVGLGLAISKSIVDLHRGSISAASEGSNRGASITVCLPLAAVDETAVRSTGISFCQHTAHLHILLVEDNEQIRITLARILRREGHDVQAEGTCAAAITAAHGQSRNNPFQVLISDLGLPDDSGLNLVKRLKSDLPSLTAIALSGYGTDDDIQKSLQAGFKTHLTKPIGIEDLRHALVA